jgi:formamidopyrimidine-DNA glycosylase
VPELPEVHTVVTDLNKHISGFTIKKAVVETSYKTVPEPKQFKLLVENQTIKNVSRLAKNILIDIGNDQTIVFHLAMSGRLLLRDSPTTDKWTRIELIIEKENVRKTLKFTDMRKFGKAVITTQVENISMKQKYGPDILEELISPQNLLDILKRKNTTIKNAIMDQKIISGLGNIYATDALFLAKIHPETNTKDLNLAAVENFLQQAKIIIKEGIKHRGATMPDKLYVDIFGNSGSQQDHFKIYLKKSCPICKSKVEYKKVNGRGTYFCPVCQKNN